MRGLRLAHLWLLLAAPALHAGPAPEAPPVVTLKLVAPKSVEPGKRLVIVAETKAPKVTWDVPAGVDALPLDGKRLAVWALPGSYEFRALVPSGEDVVSAKVVVVVTGPRPPPVPPGPGPKPPDPLPDGKLGLVKASRDGFAKVTAGREKAAELARAQRAHASAVAAGAFGDDAAKILAGWRDANRAAVSAADYAEWGRAVSAKLAELHGAGKLPTRAEWAAAFEEVSQGLGG